MDLESELDASQLFVCLFLCLFVCLVGWSVGCCCCRCRCCCLLPLLLLLLTPPVETRVFLTFFFTAFILFVGCLGGGGWGDVNVPWKRYVTYAGVGVGGGGVMLTFLGSVT